MPSDKSPQPNRITLHFTDAAKESGIEEMYIENNIVAVTVKISNLDPFTERVAIDFKKWHSMVRSLMNTVKNMLSAKGVDKIHINEVGFQIGNTLNQDKNYRLFRDLADKQATKKKDNLDDDAEVLVKLAFLPENTELFFKNQYGEPYVAVRIGKDKHLELMQLQSKKYEGYLIRLFFENCGKRIIGSDVVNRALNLLEANTLFDDKTVPLNIRVAWGKPVNRARSDCIYYDMSDSQWRIIEVSTSGWRIISGSDTVVPILFKRHNQTPQLEPDTVHNSDILDRFLNLTNIRDENQRQLLKVYIVSLLVPEIDHVILTTYGPKGAAKTFLLWLIKMLIDPSKPVLLTLLRNIPEFIQQVNHNYLAFYDNVKYIPYWLSDEICKVVTGIGHTKRKLYTDDQDIVLEHRHCIGINGIDVALTEPDAMDRSLFIKLEEIDENNVRKKEDLVQEFEKIRSKLLGFIFDTLVKAMIVKPTLRLSQLSRMADFTEWGEAISRALGYEDESFLKAYHENRNDQNIVAVEENIVGRILVKFYKSYEGRNKENPKFLGSPEELHKELVNYAEQYDISTNSRQFPRAANILVKKLNAIKSNLKEGYGLIVCISRDKENNSVISISRAKTEDDIRNLSKFRVIQNYYQHLVLRHHTHNHLNSPFQSPYLTELTSIMSDPPPNARILNSQFGGTEAPEVKLDVHSTQSNEITKFTEPITGNLNSHRDNMVDLAKDRNGSQESGDFYETSNKDDTCQSSVELEKKIIVPPGKSNRFQHVTVTQSHGKGGDSDNSEMHNLALKEVLEVIKESNGSQISFNAAIESACSRNQLVRDYLGDKLTSRENKKVRKLAEIFHLYRDNIEVIKTRPQIILRWMESTDSNGNRTSAI